MMRSGEVLWETRTRVVGLVVVRVRLAFGQQPDRFRVPGTGAHQACRGDGYNSFTQHHGLPISSVRAFTSQLNRRAAPGVLSRLGAARFWFSQVSTAIFALHADATRARQASAIHIRILTAWRN